MWSGDLLLLLCKEVSVLQQDCVYIETYIMAQLYAKLLLKFSFLWESVVQALLISVYCCFLPLLLWQIKVSYPCVFCSQLPQSPTPHFAYSSEGSGLRVGGPLKHLTKQSKAKQREQSTTLHSCQFLLYPSSSRWQLFSCIWQSSYSKNCVVFSLLTNFQVVFFFKNYYYYYYF